MLPELIHAHSQPARKTVVPSLSGVLHGITFLNPKKHQGPPISNHRTVANFLASHSPCNSHPHLHLLLTLIYAQPSCQAPTAGSMCFLKVFYPSLKNSFLVTITYSQKAFLCNVNHFPSQDYKGDIPHFQMIFLLQKNKNLTPSK